MAKISFGSISRIVNGLTLNNGLPYFQKSVPAALRPRVGKATIKIPLKAEYGNVAVQCHRLNERYTALFKAMKADGSLVPSEVKLAALALLEQSGLRVGEGRTAYPAPAGVSQDRWDPTGHVGAFVDLLQDQFDEPNELTRSAVKALNGELPVLLSEAFSVYLENHPRGQDKRFQEAQRQHWNKLVALLGDKAADSVSRDDARCYRDHRLACGVAPSTVAREINAIRAVFNKAIREIPLTCRNPFEALTIPNGSRNAKEREAYTREEIQHLVDAARKVDDEKRRIVLVLATTGARLAEVVGLRKRDVDLKTGTIHIQEHAGRSLKTSQSARQVPLLPIALEALRKQIADTDADFVFPCYAGADGTNSDSASAALNKWAGKLVSGKSMHCFRHSMRDQLRAVMCPEAVSKEIGGWSGTHDISVHYGQGYPIQIKREWLQRAYAWLT